VLRTDEIGNVLDVVNEIIDGGTVLVTVGSDETRDRVHADDAASPGQLLNGCVRFVTYVGV
jgi:hypothetical protein